MIITLEEYEEGIRLLHPSTDETNIQISIKNVIEAMERAKREDNEQHFIDCATMKPCMTIHPDGRIEFIRGQLSMYVIPGHMVEWE